MNVNKNQEIMTIEQIDNRVKEIMRELYLIDLGIGTGKRKLKKEFQQLSEQRLILVAKEKGIEDFDINGAALLFK
jgi:hypothetical protein